MLREYHWPGNVRELKNLIERIVILNPQVRVDARHIPLTRRAQAAVDRPLDASAACRRCARRRSASTSSRSSKRPTGT